MIRAAVAAARRLGLARAARALAALLPRRFAVALEGRIYQLNRRAGNVCAHVAEAELQERFADALARLDGEPGDYLEFGVYVGATMTCFDRARRERGLHGVRLIGFDSFAGMPAHAGEEGAGFSLPGLFRASADEARANLARHGVDLDRVTLVEGWFEDTLNDDTRRALQLERAGVIMLDCDLCSSSRAALEFALPLIRGRAAVFLDDWGHGGEAGQRRAWREFLAAHPELATTELGSYPAGGHADGGRVFMVHRA